MAGPRSRFCRRHIACVVSTPTTRSPSRRIAVTRSLTISIPKSSAARAAPGHRVMASGAAALLEKLAHHRIAEAISMIGTKLDLGRRHHHRVTPSTIALTAATFPSTHGCQGQGHTPRWQHQCQSCDLPITGNAHKARFIPQVIERIMVVLRQCCCRSSPFHRDIAMPCTAANNTRSPGCRRRR